ncbi:MAG: Hsp70 family protein [Myxococcales bacterium]|nr:Hsp70 family protein [Myxococcales bacterium]
MERVIGIDLGTTNSCVAIVEGGVPLVLPGPSGQRAFPAVLAIDDQGQRIIGQTARRQCVLNAEHTATALKRLLGLRFGHPQVRQLSEMVAYRITSGPSDELRVVLRNEQYAVTELVAALLLDLKKAAEAYLGQPVSRTVLTAPLAFSDAQRIALRDAARLAGLEVLRIIADPIAAALAHGIGTSEHRAQRVAVYDLGGGTFDFALLEMSSGVHEIRASTSDAFLGGQDFDRRLLDYLVFGFAKDHKIDLRQDRTALQRLRDAVEKAKCDLSVDEEVTIEVPFIISTGTSEPLHLHRVIHRTKFEELTEDLVERTIQLCKGALSEAGVEPRSVDAVVVVGGMARVPRIQRALTELFGRVPMGGVTPEEALAIGAALQGAALSQTPSASTTFELSPHHLGLLVGGGKVFRLISAGTQLPHEAAHIFTTARDHQTALRLVVVEGDSEQASDCKILGEFVYSGFLAASRENTEVEVRFSAAQNGDLTVTATDLREQRREQHTFRLSASLLSSETDGSKSPMGSYELETQRSDELSRNQNRAEQLISDILGMLPRAEQAVAGSELGLDAMRRARSAIERARIAIIRGESVAIIDARQVLERTAAMLRGVTASLR